MQYTQAQIDRANAVSLEDFLRTQGETLIKSGREYRWKEHDSLTVRGNKWFRHSQSKGGYPIDFVMEFYSYTISLAKNREIAEEIAQNTFYKAVSTTSQFKGKSDELTWLCSIAKNLYRQATDRKPVEVPL